MRHVVHLPRTTLQCLVTISVVTITRCPNYGRKAAVRRIFRRFCFHSALLRWHKTNSLRWIYFVVEGIMRICFLRRWHYAWSLEVSCGKWPRHCIRTLRESNVSNSGLQLIRIQNPRPNFMLLEPEQTEFLRVW